MSMEITPEEQKEVEALRESKRLAAIEQEALQKIGEILKEYNCNLEAIKEIDKVVISGGTMEITGIKTLMKVVSNEREKK